MGGGRDADAASSERERQDLPTAASSPSPQGTFSSGMSQPTSPSISQLSPSATMHHDATDPKLPSESQTLLLPRGHQALGSPGSPGDGDAVGGIDGEGQAPGEMAGLLYQIMFMAPMHCCLEVCIECAAIQLHQIQDGSCQGFHDLLCEREGSEGKVMRPKRAPSCCHGTG